ncbi:9758_t:CDS:10 [Diversispora eburnea]|uniref:RNA helicase n=1 Tax=Diversispora eburnea TaxID=1213867 RepID=A0A9N8W559_9GLOM|nr:9758_t:CDS:10 [Diversispora eburnea]
MEFKDLDPRLTRALSKLKFHKPTLVQAEVIPLALARKDILARARTGSGKTAAYCLPAIKESPENAIRSIILVPTRELAEQVTQHIKCFIIYCSKEIKVVNIASSAPVELQRPILSELPDIIVSTPSRLLASFEAQNLDVRNTLESFVIDEADLVLSYGYEEDIQKIITYLPKIFQCYMMSATLRRRKIETFVFAESSTCSEADKFLLTYVILKLRLIKGKCIMFVNDIDRCYRLKLFLDQFSIRSCVLNSELPLNSRYHIVQEFNKGIYDYIVATDEGDYNSNRDSEDEDEDERKTEERKKKNSDKQKKDDDNNNNKKEYGVSRGIDFINVSAVINFDFPISAKAYTHRIGRTARANNKGMSLSFIVPKELVGKQKNLTSPTSKNDEEIYARVEKQQTMMGATLKPYSFDMKQVEGFRYRMEDALRAVTRSSIKEARLKDNHFEGNPNDLKILRHDATIHPSRVQQHMKNVPPYLMPKIATPAGSSSLIDDDGVGNVPFRKSKKNNKHHRNFGSSFGLKKRKNDPLKSFSFSGKNNKRQKKN